MSLTLADLSELEQLEAKAEASLQECARQRANLIGILDRCRADTVRTQTKYDACKQSLVESGNFDQIAEWEKLLSDEMQTADEVIRSLANLEGTTRSWQRTLSIVRNTLSTASLD